MLDPAVPVKDDLLHRVVCGEEAVQGRTMGVKAGKSPWLFFLGDSM